MATATKKSPRKRPVLAEYEDKEQTWARAMAEASRRWREFNAVNLKMGELIDQRRRLLAQDRRLVDRHDQPVSDNEVSLIDRELANLPDLTDLRAEADHADKIAAQEKQRFDAYAASNIDALLVELRPIGQAKVAAEQEAAEAYLARVKETVTFGHRVMSLAVVARRDTYVPGFEAATQRVRAAERIANIEPEVPLP